VIAVGCRVPGGRINGRRSFEEEIGLERSHVRLIIARRRVGTRSSLFSREGGTKCAQMRPAATAGMNRGTSYPCTRRYRPSGERRAIALLESACQPIGLHRVESPVIVKVPAQQSLHRGAACTWKLFRSARRCTGRAPPRRPACCHRPPYRFGARRDAILTNSCGRGVKAHAGSVRGMVPAPRLQR